MNTKQYLFCMVDNLKKVHASGRRGVEGRERESGCLDGQNNVQESAYEIGRTNRLKYSVNYDQTSLNLILGD